MSVSGPLSLGQWVIGACTFDAVAYLLYGLYITDMYTFVGIKCTTYRDAYTAPIANGMVTHLYGMCDSILCHLLTSSQPW